MTTDQITIHELKEQLDDLTIIDVRSPAEYAEFHIPGAHSLPLFSNEERARVGTLYTQKGHDEAKEEGIKILSRKLPDLYNELKQWFNKKPLVFYCWRGGMRSRSLCALLSAIGIPCRQLKGGIRSFRKLIMADLEELGSQFLQKKCFVVEGMTGSRKTDLLEALDEKGYPVIDLEGMAEHRGSIFGFIGLKPNSQKMFDYLLWHRLTAIKDKPYFFMEGESRRIGRIVLPEFLMTAKNKGTHLLVHYPFQKRVQAINEEYQLQNHREVFHEALMKLERHLNPAVFEEISNAESDRDYESAIRLLLEYYYDRKYSFKIDRYENEPVNIHFENLDEGLRKIETFISELNVQYTDHE